METLNKYFSECPLGVKTIFHSTVTKINEGDSLRLSRSRLIGETDMTHTQARLFLGRMRLSSVKGELGEAL